MSLVDSQGTWFQTEQEIVAVTHFAEASYAVTLWNKSGVGGN